jgi:hypothetical protein
MQTPSFHFDTHEDNKRGNLESIASGSMQNALSLWGIRPLQQSQLTPFNARPIGVASAAKWG